MVSDKNTTKTKRPSKEAHIPLKDINDVIIFDATINAILERHGEQGAPGWLQRKMNVSSTDEERDELHERLQAADDAIRYLVDFLIKHHSDFPLIDVCKNTKNEIDRLHKAIKKAARKNKISMDRLEEGLIKEAVYKEYDDNIQSFKHVKREHLDIVYEFSGGQIKRDFRDSIIRKIIQEMNVNIKQIQKKISSFHKTS